MSTDFDALSYLDAPPPTPTEGGGPQPIATGHHVVHLPSGAAFEVLTEAEAEQVTHKVEEYLRQYALENVSDLGALDGVIQLELISYRFSLWISRRGDYAGKKIDENQLAQRVKEISGELRQVRKNLGIDKVARDRAKGEGSVHERMAKLLAAAERFGIHRNMQQAKGIELAMELIALRRESRNLPNNEVGDKIRKERAITDKDIISWIDTFFEPEFMQLDADYRANDQKSWIRTMSTY